MGEEYGETAPFPYFTDHGDDDSGQRRAARARAASSPPSRAARELLDPHDPEDVRALAARLDLRERRLARPAARRSTAGCSRLRRELEPLRRLSLRDASVTRRRAARHVLLLRRTRRRRGARSSCSTVGAGESPLVPLPASAVAGALRLGQRLASAAAAQRLACRRDGLRPGTMRRSWCSNGCRPDARLARSPLPARRHLGRRGRQLRDLLGARDGRRALPVRRADADAVARERIRCTRAHRPESGTATCPTCGPGSSTATASTGRTRRAKGHRFNPAKLLLDPYAQGDQRQGRAGTTTVFGYTIGHPDADLHRDDRDSAGAMPKCVVIDPAFTWGDDRPPRMPWNEHRDLRGARAGPDEAAPGRARGAARHLPRLVSRPDPRPPHLARRHRRRAAAGAPLRQRPRRWSSGASRTTGATTRSASSRPRCATPPAGAASRSTSSSRW